MSPTLIRAQESPGERAAQLDAQERQDRRWQRRRISAYVGGCVGSLVFGLGLMALGVHSADATAGPLLFWSGLLIGDAGVCASLYHFYRSSDEAV